MTPRYAIGLVLTAAVCYGTLATLTKLGLAHGLHVGQINGVQITVGTVLLWAAALDDRIGIGAASGLGTPGMDGIHRNGVRAAMVRRRFDPCGHCRRAMEREAAG